MEQTLKSQLDNCELSQFKPFKGDDMCSIILTGAKKVMFLTVFCVSSRTKLPDGFLTKRSERMGTGPQQKPVRFWCDSDLL